MTKRGRNRQVPMLGDMLQHGVPDRSNEGASSNTIFERGLK
ncbi:hypothetical protein EYZ11_012413 [Aspergillus tanneri]|uniref:Uncharacterized protein n=1 Tax=Aspergillus tanneri TaxID=1220188 RepID=A0A4V6RQM6_9EURO|nr:hypothetical protein EYZ11_012413 [Aspergillus tanneri]